MATAQHSQPVEVLGGASLKDALARAERRNKLRAMALVAPLLLFIGLTFLAPIVRMMVYSFDNPVVHGTFPKTLAALEDWDPAGAPTPPEAAYAALAEEIARAGKNRTVGRAATRLNYDMGGMRGIGGRRHLPEVLVDISPARVIRCIGARGVARPRREPGANG